MHVNVCFHLVGLAVRRNLAGVGVDVNHVVHLEAVHVALDGEGSRVFHRVEEDGSDLVPDADAAAALVGDEGHVVAHVPEDGVGG